MNDIQKNSKEIEKLTNALIATDVMKENNEALSLLKQIKEKNYATLDLLNAENFEILDDDAFNKKCLEIDEIFDSVEYKNGELKTEKLKNWLIKTQKPTAELKRDGFYPIEEMNTLWGKGNRSKIVMELDQGIDGYGGFVVRTLQDTLEDFKKNVSLKVNFCSTFFSVKEIGKNLFLVVFSLKQKNKLAEVELGYASPKSPDELGIGKDKRLLSFCLYEILTIANKEKK